MGLRSIPLMVLLAASSVSSETSPGGDELAWLAGSWCGGERGERIEETWLAPVRGETIGMSRTVRDGRATAFEFVRIARIDGVLTYLAQPGGVEATAFRSTGAGAQAGQ